MIFKLLCLFLILISSGFSKPNCFQEVDLTSVGGRSMIQASQPYEVDLSKTTVVNLFTGTALTLAGQLDQAPRVLKAIKDVLKSQGKSPEAIALAQRQAKELLQDPEVALMVEAHEAAVQEVEQGIQNLEANLEALEEKREVLKLEELPLGEPPLGEPPLGEPRLGELPFGEPPLAALQTQMESLDLSMPEGPGLVYQVAAIDHDQKVQALSHKLLLTTAEMVERFETFLEKNPTVAKTLRYGVEGVQGALMITGVKGLVTSGLPKALVALGLGEALNTASAWAGEKVEGLVAEVATSESEAQRFMKALKTCAGTAGFVVGVKIATKSLKALKSKPVIKDALSEKPIIKDGKIFLGEVELGSANRNLKLHKNDLRYHGKTHVYQITDATTGELWKIGESARGVNELGLSKRAEAQARELRNLHAHEFKTKVLETFNGKVAAKARETELITSLRAQGHKLPGNKGVH